MKKVGLFWVVFLGLVACVSDASFSTPDIVCEEVSLVATHTIAQIKEMSGYGIVSFESDIVIEGYVVSSDESGNIYKSISIQDKAENPTAAIRFSVDKTNLYAVFPLGRKVYVNLKGLSIGYSYGTLQIGKAVGNELERIPDSQVFDHFVRSCESEEILPNEIDLSEINDAYLESLVQLNNVQFSEQDMNSVYGELSSTKTIERIVEQTTENCEVEAKINVVISGYSDFKNQEIPMGKGSVVGVLSKYYSAYQLILRDENDVELNAERCGIVNRNSATILFSEIVEMYVDEVVEFGIDKEYIFEGYVISNDQEGNFTNTIFIQDKIENPSGGFKLLVDKENLFESFQIGAKVHLKLNHLYLDKIDGVYTIGVYENNSVGEIEEEAVNTYLINSGEHFEIIPFKTSLDKLSLGELQNTLVTISDVQLVSSELGKAFAYYSGDEDGLRNLESCDDSKILGVETLGTASFSNSEFPKGKGEITGVLYKENTKLKIQMRSVGDIDLQKSREECLVVESKILITEVADPENNIGARFIELYNQGDVEVTLDGWRLHKYLNGSNSVSSSGLDLSGLVIPAKGFVVIANTGFDAAFSMNADLVSSYISATGDDVYELIDKQGQIHDAFGVKGEDGTGMAWEYLDGNAVRKLEVVQPNSVFDISEWEILTKATGNKQLAPENFAPGVR